MPGGCPARPRVLVLLAGDKASLENALTQLGRIGDRGLSVACLVSDEVKDFWSEGEIAGALGHVSFVDLRDAAAAVSCTDVAVVPVLPLHVAARAALLTGNDAATKALIAALAEGKRVYAAADSLAPSGQTESEGAKRGGHGFALRRQADEYLKKLREYGMIVVDSKDLARELERGIRIVNPGSAASSASFTDSHGASQASRGTAASPTKARPESGANSADSGCSRLFGECSACGKCVQENPDGTARIVEAGASRIGAAPGVGAIAGDVAAMIDHTLLKPDATKDQVIKLCEEAKQYNFASVCVNPTNVSLAASILKGTPVKVCTVIGFPLGATTPTAKAIETRDAIANGATEVDMVINVGALKSGDYDLVKRDIEAVVDAARGKAIVKVIIETALLTDEEKVKACLLAKLAGADFVKTSTGFGPGGATVEDIRLMRKVVGSDMGVKASGGIRNLESARKMIEAGASRIGASASVAIVKGQ
jgi:deoxyribose-phosphate aldolase